MESLNIESTVGGITNHRKSEFKVQITQGLPLRCNIDNQEDLPLIDAEINIVSLGILQTQL